MSDPIRVLVVDDSALFRLVLARAIGRADGIEVVGTAADGLDALVAIRKLQPDVVTLDLEMPRLDGLGTLRRVLTEGPVRVVMVSRATKTGAEVTIDALRLGAIDVIAKPDATWTAGQGTFLDELIAKIRGAAMVPLDRILRGRPTALRRPLSAHPHPARGSRTGAARTEAQAASLIVVATSTGGPRALDVVLRGLPARLSSAVVIVQHMLTGFTATLAERLDGVSALDVREAASGDRLLAGLVLLAPGDRHLHIDQDGRVRLVRSAPVHGLRPAADVTLSTAAPIWGPRLLSVVLTGMGHDGTQGSALVRASGGYVIAQDEGSSVVFGMPRSVAQAGQADHVLPLDQIAGAMAEWERGLADPRSDGARGEPDERRRAPCGNRVRRPIPRHGAGIRVSRDSHQTPQGHR